MPTDIWYFVPSSGMGCCSKNGQGFYAKHLILKHIQEPSCFLCTTPQHEMLNLLRVYSQWLCLKKPIFDNARDKLSEIMSEITDCHQYFTQPYKYYTNSPR